jgi:hypothetical protein
MRAALAHASCPARQPFNSLAGAGTVRVSKDDMTLRLSNTDERELTG